MLAFPVVLWHGGRTLSRLAVICIVGVLGWTGCGHRTGPDASYQQAFTLYQRLYATQLDDAYGDPKMDEVVALLRAVDSRSSDAEAAQNLLGTIQRGREALAKERAEREKVTAAAKAPPTSSDIDPSKFFPPAAPDAGAQDPFGPGASVAELNVQSGGCLADNEPFTEQGTGVTGTVYRVAPTEACRNKLPGLAGQIVLVVGGKIYRRTADPRPPPAAAPDAGVQTASRTAPPPAKPKPADAPPQYQVVYPGQPMPQGMVPATPQQQQ